ncbi:MAG: iron ABC transporter permease [Flavobacteriales bacterium]|nr:iron ABC transporter permease [Flavobacteriales bacterium]
MPVRKSLLFAALVLLGVVLFVADLLLGSSGLRVTEVLGALLKIEGADAVHVRIVQEVRVPQAITAACAGGALAACGLLMQTLFRNPLAGPGVLGVTSGAGLGVAILMLGGGGSLGALLPAGVLAAAFVGAMAVLLLIVLADRRIGDGATLLIVGLMTGYLCSALVSVLELYAPAHALKGFVVWGMGSFNGKEMKDVAWLLPVVLIGCLAAWLHAKPLNALLAGEEQATTLGLNVRRTRSVLIAFSGLLASVVTAFCGPVSFIGLATPHVARGLFRTADHRVLIPASIISGTCLALLCDVITRLPGIQGTLPLNAVTSLLGAPVVLWVLWQGRNWYRAA